ncbi:MAG: cobalamin biosynthesis protein, partial [Sulfolobus sp.]|nr:cobalamin biosynthesis protein [Sulfolobus sp.]
MYTLITLFIALAIDLTIGEPPEVIHPVVICGKISEKVRKPFGSRIHGILTWSVSVLPLLFILSVLPLYITNIFIKILITAFILKT